MINQDLKNYGKTKTVELSERTAIIISMLGAIGMGLMLGYAV